MLCLGEMAKTIYIHGKAEVYDIEWGENLKKKDWWSSLRLNTLGEYQGFGLTLSTKGRCF